MNPSLLVARLVFFVMAGGALLLGGVFATRIFDFAANPIILPLLLIVIFVLPAGVWLHVGIRLSKGVVEKNLRAAWYLAVMLFGPMLLAAASVSPVLASFPITYDVVTACIVLSLPVSELGFRLWLRGFVKPPA